MDVTFGDDEAYVQLGRGRVARSTEVAPGVILDLAEDGEAVGMAPTQGVLVERAVRDVDREVRNELHTRLWTEATQDPEFRAEMKAIWDGLAADDHRAWELGEG